MTRQIIITRLVCEPATRAHSSIPVVPIQISALHRFGQVFRRNRFGMIEIGNRPGNAQHPIVGAGREIHATDRHFQSPLAGFIERAKSPDLRRRDLRVIEATFTLDFACRLDSLTNLGG